MQKRLLALFLVLSLTVGTTCTVYAAEDTEESSGEEHHDSGEERNPHLWHGRVRQSRSGIDDLSLPKRAEASFRFARCPG